MNISNPLSLRLVWTECDWAWYTRNIVYRPTEDLAFGHLQMAADRYRYTVGSIDFDESDWLVYLKDFELRMRWSNALVSHIDIARELAGYTTYRVSAILNRIDQIISLRDDLNLAPIPPIPLRHKRKVKHIKVSYAKRKVARTA